MKSYPITVVGLQLIQRARFNNDDNLVRASIGVNAEIRSRVTEYEAEMKAEDDALIDIEREKGSVTEQARILLGMEKFQWAIRSLNLIKQSTWLQTEQVY